MRVEAALLGVSQKRCIACIHIRLLTAAFIVAALIAAALLAHCPLSLWAKIMWCV
jgi:hypothetical protein